jgi:hypothetical protein
VLYQYFSQVRRGISVCVRSLNDTDFDLDSRSFDKIHDEHGRQTRNFIPIKETHKTICIDIVIHQSVCITIKTTPTFQRRKNRSRRKFLLSFDIIRSTLHQYPKLKRTNLIIQFLWIMRVIIDNSDFKIVISQIFKKFC